MPGNIIRPELKPLTSESKKYLLRTCASQPDEVILHYLETQEIKISDLTTLPASRVDSLKNRFDEWLHEPDPAEINAWDAIKTELDNPFSNDEDLASKLREFLHRFPTSEHKAVAESKLREIEQVRLAAQFAPLLTEWQNICALSEDNLHQMEMKEERMTEFIRTNHRVLDSQIGRFQQDQSMLKDRIARKKLEAIRFDFDELLRTIRKQQPGSDLFSIADEYLWSLITEDLNIDMLRQFTRKVQNSSHYTEAEAILTNWSKWEPVKNSCDIFAIWEFLENNDNLPEAIKDEAEDALNRLKRKEIEKMEENPSAYSRRTFLGLINAGILSINDLINRDLITSEAYQTARNRDSFIRENPINVNYVHSELLEQDDITDVYLFGVPSTGKTCVLMGLLGSDLYDWNNAIAAGEYGDILTLYRDNQTLPDRTLNEQFFCIHGNADDENGKKHLINVIELAGEQFLSKIAMNPKSELSLIDMDAIAAEHLRNKNRKIFFIVIDPTVKEINYEKQIKSVDDEGNVIETTKIYRVAQKTVIKKMMNILRDPVNAKIMKSVDALHFIATKSDVIDHAGKDVKDCVMEYNDSFKVAYEICQPKNAQINEATGYKPKLYPFSLGKFYVGGAFEYDSSDSDNLMRVITENTLAIRDYSFVEKFCDKILNFKVF